MIADDRLRELLAIHRGDPSTKALRSVAEGEAIADDVAAALVELAQRRRAMGSPSRESCYDESLVPPHLLADLLAYVQHGQPPGDTLLAILINDARDAFRRADYATARGMGAIFAWLYNKAPSGSYGSAQHVSRWLRRHRLRRAWKAALEHDYYVKDPWLDPDAPVLCTAITGDPRPGRFAGVSDGGLRFQLAVEWPVLFVSTSGSPWPVFVSLGRDETYRIVLDQDDEHAVAPPDANNVIVVRLHNVEIA